MENGYTLRDLYAALENRSWNSWATDPSSYHGVMTLDAMGRAESHDWLAQQEGKDHLYKMVLAVGRDEALRIIGDDYRASIVALVLTANTLADVYAKLALANREGLDEDIETEEDLDLATNYRGIILTAMMRYHLGLSWRDDEDPTELQLSSYIIAAAVWFRLEEAYFADETMKDRGIIDVPFIVLNDIVAAGISGLLDNGVIADTMEAEHE